MKLMNLKFLNYFVVLCLTLILGNSCSTLRVKRSSFNKQQIIRLTNTPVPRNTEGEIMIGVFFKIARHTLKNTKRKTERIDAVSAVLRGKIHSEGTVIKITDKDIIFRPLDLSGIETTDVPIPQYSDQGINLETTNRLPSEYRNTDEFEVVFFTQEELMRLATYEFNGVRLQSKGIVLDRIVDYIGNGQKFQSLKAYTDPPFYDVVGSSDIDHHAYELGEPCPPKWDNTPTQPSAQGKKYSNIIKLSNGRQIELYDLFELYRNKFNRGGQGGSPILFPQPPSRN